MVSKLRINYVDRPIPKSGTFDFERFNSSQDECSVDLSNIATKWNDDLYPLISTIPQGTAEDRWAGATNVPDPWEDGLHGDTIFVDNEATATKDNGIFWDISNSRPRTIRESEIALYSYIDAIDETLQASINTQSNGGLTDEQWTRLGDYVKVGTVSTDPSALDYKVFNQGVGRLQWDFSGHTDLNTPIVISHNQGIAFPLVQVIDTTTTGGDYSGLLADENYTYEASKGITASAAFVNIEYLSINQFRVYTNINTGKVIACF